MMEIEFSYSNFLEESFFSIIYRYKSLNMFTVAGKRISKIGEGDIILKTNVKKL